MGRGGVSKMGMAFLAALLAQNVMYTLLRGYASRVLHQRWSPSDVLLAGELMKFAMAAGMTIIDRSPSDVQAQGPEKITWLIKHSKELLFPAFVYLAMNLLSYVALARISAGLFSVLAQLKVLSTGMFGLFMLGRTYSWTQWRAMILVGMGAALVTQANRAHVKDSSTVAAKSDELSITFIVGVAAVLGEILLSGMVTVYFERVLKSKTEVLSVWDRNVQLSFHSMIMYFFYGMVINGGSIFTNWTFAASGITFLGAIGGLLTALAVKYTDSVMKAVGQSMGVVACLIIEWLLMDGPLNLVNGIGSCVVVIAVLNYVDASNPSTTPKDNTPQPMTDEESEQLMKEDTTNIVMVPDSLSPHASPALGPRDGIPRPAAVSLL